MCTCGTSCSFLTEDGVLATAWRHNHPTRFTRLRQWATRRLQFRARGEAVATAALLAQLEGKSGVEAFGGFYGVTAKPGEADTARVQDGEDDAGGVAALGTCPVRKPAA